VPSSWKNAFEGHVVQQEIQGERASEAMRMATFTPAISKMR